MEIENPKLRDVFLHVAALPNLAIARAAALLFFDVGIADVHVWWGSADELGNAIRARIFHNPRTIESRFLDAARELFTTQQTCQDPVTLSCFVVRIAAVELIALKGQMAPKG